MLINLPKADAKSKKKNRFRRKKNRLGLLYKFDQWKKCCPFLYSSYKHSLKCNDFIDKLFLALHRTKRENFVKQKL